MVIRSQNGWPAYATTEHFTRSSVCGFGFWSANADVAVVFSEFIHRFDLEVEPVTQPKLDDWSYANRLVRDSTSVVSNHGSATAIDLNALKHPRGVRNTFSPAKAARVRKIKDEITDDAGDPVLRLGMDFQTTVDDMHVEINADAARVKQAADKIRARAQEEDDVVDDKVIARIAEAVARQPIPNKNPDAPDGKPSSIGGSIVDIERTQDGHTKAIAEIKVEQAAQRTLLTEILARLPADPRPAKQ